MAELPSGTVTFLFTDIEGSTARWEHQPDAMRVALARHDAMIRAAIEEHGGHVVKTMGDAFHAAFSRAPDAVAAALAAQRRLQAEPWGEIGPLRVRMALHTGAAEERDGDYYGPPLNRAARLLATGHGGQVLLSEATAGLVRDTLPDGVRLLDLGRHRLKDLTEPERVSQVVAQNLPSDFPLLASLDARPHNLPTHPTALLGRGRALADVRALFGDGARLVTLTGPGGTGKTRLGLQVAAEALENFEHGVFLVELAPITDPALVPSAVAQVLGVRDVGNRPILDALKEFLRHKTLLLILDNFEQVVAAAPIVADLLAASPGLAALVTSREPLRVRGEREYAVPPLEVPDLRQPTPLESLSRNAAVALFVERAVAVRPDFVLTTANAGAVARICARLDGLPLAIELAAARARLLSPEATLARLDRRLPLLTGGARDLPARQRTLRDTIAWSHDLLTGSEQRLFRRLSIFVGGCTLEAAEAVCINGDDRETEILDELASLVAKSLLREDDGPTGEPRFAMLETIREYGLEQLEASGEATDLRQRHLTWFLELTERFDRRLGSFSETVAQEVLDVDLDNIRVALLWSEDPSSDLDLGLRLVGAAREFWTFKGYLREGRAWVTRLLARSTVRTAGRADALHTAGYLAVRQGDYEPASALLEEALAIWRALDNTYEIAVTLRSLGQLSQHLRDYEQARAFLEESLLLNRQIDHPRETNVVLRILADLALERAEYGEAAAAYEQCLPLAQRRGDVHEIAYTLRGLGNIARAQGEYARGRELLRDSLRLLATLGDRRCTPFCLEGLACTETGADWAERATRLLAAAHALQETTGSPAPPMELADYQRTEADARAQLGEERFAAVWAAGAAMSFDDAVAYALAEGAPAPTAGSGPTDVPLSAREREVVALIAAGKSDGEIAHQLALGVAIVERHVEEIYNRLGISGTAARAILTAYARRHRLVEPALEERL